MLVSWDKLPQEMKSEEVKAYYDILLNKKASLLFKRIFDIVVSILMIVLLSWLFIVLAIAIKIDSRGPVFYRQERITSANKPFRIFKFRTMVDNADRMGSLVTVGKDNRVTRVGAKIRKCRLDEIPQLFNVLKGEMTFVGTRPEVKKYVDKYSNQMLATLLLPAGITSLASINFKDEDGILLNYSKSGVEVDEAYIKHVLPKKMEYNLKYMKDFNFCADIKLMIQTVVSVLK
ncbi:MAG: sugar transferase [Clostridiales bacterium]|nr:sugar transferase [Clostridiales bacterium]